MLPPFQKLYFCSGQSSENPRKGAYKQRAPRLAFTTGSTEETDRTPTMKQKCGRDGSDLERTKVLPKKENKTTKIVPECPAPTISTTWFSLSSSQS